MKIEILGTRAKIEPSAPKYEQHTGFLIDDKILLDVGEESFLKKNPEAILFTHFHPDHAFFLFENTTFESEIPHYGPEEHQNIPDLNVITSPVTLNGYKFTPIPVIHALKLKSFAYLVEKDNQRVLFTGDVAWIEKVELAKLPKLDLIITEATIIKKGGRINRSGDRIYGHTGVPDIIRLFSPLTEMLVFTHYGEWFYEDPKKGRKTLKLMETENLQLIPAHDGMVLTV